MQSANFQRWLAQLVREVCELDVETPKPGNVSRQSPGHGMRYEDFIASAQAIALPITAPGISVGERILTAVRATREVAPTNTNLGIVLLAAPLIQAAWRRKEQADTDQASALEQVLLELSVADAEAAYDAIRLASPGGLGTVPEHDVAQPPSINLRVAMDAAAERDTIALQYASGYRLVLELGVNCIERTLAQGIGDRFATLSCYLAMLARVPDSLIVRKHGYGVARDVSLKAAPFMQALEENHSPESLLPRLAEWDRELKEEQINPGTTADLTVASLLAHRLQQLPLAG